MKQPPRNNEVGARLRQLRKERKISGRELARRLNCAQSYVSKMEVGALYPNLEFLEKVALELKLSKSEQIALKSLFSLYQVESYPLPNSPEALSERQELIRTLESKTKVTLATQNVVVPGLLQTEGYIRSMYQRTGTGSESLDKIVRSRLKRQSVVLKPGKQFVYILFESALRTQICDLGEMARQCEHLAKINSNAVQIRVIPWKTPLSVLAPSPFQINDRQLVIVETVTGFITIRNESEIEQHIQCFNHCLEASLSLIDTNLFLRELANEYRSQDAG
jgi:transcriptional regulator with XRE-family HTH domain